MPQHVHPQLRLSPEDLAELAKTAGDKGKSSTPMSNKDRLANYEKANEGRTAPVWVAWNIRRGKPVATVAVQVTRAQRARLLAHATPAERKRNS